MPTSRESSPPKSPPRSAASRRRCNWAFATVFRGPGAAKLDNVHLVSLRAIGDLIAILRPQRVIEVKRALGHALAWPELMGL